MPHLDHLTKFFFLALLVIAALACKKEEPGDAIYELKQIRVEPAHTGKSKIKSAEQYISILHTNFFRKPISVNRLVDYTEALYSMGDQQLAREILISNFMNDPEVVIPSDNEVRINFDDFLLSTYQRFFVRNPSEAEKVWFRNYVSADEHVTPELMYFSFALSSEYQAY